MAVKRIDDGLPRAVGLAVPAIGLALAIFATDSYVVGAAILVAAGLLGFALARLLSNS